MNTVLLLFNYLILISIIIFTFRNLYQNFYAKKILIGAIVLIFCIIGLLFSFVSVRITNDILIPTITTKYNLRHTLLADIIAVTNIGIAFGIIKYNRKKEGIKRSQYLKENHKNWDKFYSVLRDNEKIIKNFKKHV